MNIIIAGVL